ncbi:hypothetical protein AX16_007540 [Volvariella volvacea WC 439]|nr:hypothetical protein AX16_007540 [Volvariella volvacea WC 439]
MLTNITVDNVNNTAIHYYPPLCNGTGWNEDNGLAAYAYDLTYAYCSARLGAHVEFKFTGVAVYFTIPQFEEKENMWFQLDERPFEQVDITSPTGTALRSRVVWSAENLTNTEHTLLMYPGTYDGDTGYVSVDAFIYTASDEPVAGAQNSSSDSGSNKTAIGVGVGLAIVILGLIAVLAFFFIRGQKEKRQKANATAAYANPVSQMGGGPTSVPQHDSGFRASAMVSPHSTGAQSVGFVTQMPQFSGNGYPQQTPQTTGPGAPGTIYV